MRSPRLGRAAICLAVLVLAVDQVSKALVVAVAPRGLGGGVVSVRLVRNTGASFGIGAGHPVLITVVAAAMLAAAVIWLVRTRRPGVALCLAVVAGGAAGNLADRLLRSPGPGRGAVVDWIHVAGYPPRSISRTWPSAPERPARSWRRWPRAAGQHAARQPRDAASLAGERCDAADHHVRASRPGSWLGTCRPSPSTTVTGHQEPTAGCGRSARAANHRPGRWR